MTIFLQNKRRVQKLCEGDWIEGTVRFDYTWMIPRKTEKPADQKRIQKKDKGGNISCITHN